eukprot:6474816-Karenia_brevis.AAC.1
MAVLLSRRVGFLVAGPLLHMDDLGGTPHGERLEAPAHLPPGTFMSCKGRPTTSLYILCWPALSRP